ncbi:MAG: hypothetical protein ABEK01_04870 [Candidatus Nanohaloarchaea archaeon]
MSSEDGGLRLTDLNKFAGAVSVVFASAVAVEAASLEMTQALYLLDLFPVLLVV